MFAFLCVALAQPAADSAVSVAPAWEGEYLRARATARGGVALTASGAGGVLLGGPRVGMGAWGADAAALGVALPLVAFGAVLFLAGPPALYVGGMGGARAL